MKRSAVCLAAFALLCHAAISQRGTFSVTVDAGTRDRAGTPVCVEIEDPSAFTVSSVLPYTASVAPSDDPERAVPAQLDLSVDPPRLWWILGGCMAGERREYRVTPLLKPREWPSFSLEDTPGDHLDCLFDSRPVTRLMYLTYDPAKQEETKKVFHHVFDPAGENFITKGAGGKYPHHRGLFVGWNKAVVGDQTYDFWHLPRPQVSQRHAGFIDQMAGPVFAHETSKINWCDAEGKPVIEEERTLTVFRQEPPAILLEWSTTLRSLAGEISLNGDLHHAGFQYRAADEVAGRESETHYLHPPDGVDRPNAPEIPWSAMSYALGDSRFTVAHMNHPDNPRPTDYSDEERKYGRFGAFLTHQLKPDQPLELRYRLYIVEGYPPSPEQIDARYLDFIDPPQVTVTD